MPLRGVLVIVTGFLLIAAGLLNGWVGLLSLFPGLFEAGLSEGQQPESSEVTLGTLLAGSYGRLAVAHLAGSAGQLGAGSWIGLLAGRSGPFVHLLPVLALACLGLEAWGWAFKGYLTGFAVPGVLAGAGCVYIYIDRVRVSR